MIAATSLGDVVKQCGNVKSFGFNDLFHKLARHREFVRELGYGKTSNIAQYKQRVFIDGIYVEQVVLHLPDNLSKSRQVRPQYTVRVHATQFMCNPVALTEQLHEQAAAGNVFSEFPVDKRQAGAQLANCTGTNALEFRVLRHNQEQFHDGVRRTLENLAVCRFQEITVCLEAAINRTDPGFPPGQYRFLEMLQQNFIQQRQFLYCPVITLHKLFNRQFTFAIVISQLFCQPTL